ncbi:MAG: hypothetical protein F4X02_06605 [Chloroflexi bacterium]|nr:hypothetical protein [Chloroflexota bacterium]
MDENIGNATLDSEIHFCAVHPQRDTELRCNRCERYMCVDCAKRTPVGYTCRECVRGHENKFYQGTMIDYALVAAVSAAGGALTVFLISLTGGFLLLGFIIAPAIGGATAQFALQITGRRRGRQSGFVSAGALLLGGLALSVFLTGAVGLFSLIFLGLAASASFARFKLSI